jgi:alkylation response protein AidB-like acyl-CoA dehydrogenase
MFLVPAGTPGLRIGKVHDKLGERCANNAEVILEDCRVPDENIIGAVNQGGAGFGLVLRRRNMYTASTAIGVGEAAYAKAVERAFSRVQGGSRLIDHDTIRLELIRHRMNLDVARTYIEAMASSLDDGATSATPDMFLYPKIFAGQTALSVATSAVEIHGGLGYMKGSIVEKLLRDATQFLHAHGSDRVQLLKAARMQYDSAVVQTGYALAGDSSR